MSTHKGAKEKRLKRANALSGQAARPKNARLRQLSRKAATKAKSKRVGAAASPARFKAASAGGIAALDSRRAIGVGEVIGGALRRRFTGPGDSTNSVVDNGGGLVLTDVPLRLIFWGREWGQAIPPVPSADVIADVEKILAGPYLDAARQYGITNAYVDSIVTRDSDDPPNPFNNKDAGNLVAGLIDDGTFPEPDDDYRAALYVVFLPQQVGLPGAQQVLQLPPDLGGLHSFSSYVDYDPPIDFDDDRFYWAWVFNDGNRADISSLFSHELVEALTDPSGDTIQIKPRDPTNWNEVGDVCRSTWVLNGVTVQSYWSKIDNACVVPDHVGNDFQVKWIYRPRRIEWLGGTMGDGTPWQMPREQVMNRIRAGDQFFVHAPQSGGNVLVGIYYLDITHPYLATAPDGEPDDNLLSLPQHVPS
ncbi:MAG: DUF3892 domain-containing protein [Pseudolabrys sp.]